MKEMIVYMETGDGHCECCGSYTWEQARITVDGSEIATHAGDGHLGGAQGLEHVLAAALNALGYTVVIEHEEYTQPLGLVPYRLTEAGRAMLRDAQQSSPERQQGE